MSSGDPVSADDTDRAVIAVAAALVDVDLVAEELFTLGASAVSEFAGPDTAGGAVELLADVPVERLGELSRPFRSVDPSAPFGHPLEPQAPHDPVEVAGFVLCPIGGPSRGDPGRVIWLDPVAAFGSGTHPSTRLAVAATVDLVRPGGTVIDVGSGNGVLSVVAGRCGADSVLAIDIDPAARRATSAAAEVNGVADRVVVSDLTVEQLAGSSPPAPAAPAEVVLANVLIGVIEDHAGHLVALVAPDGALVVSGVLDTHIDRTIEAIVAAATGADRPVTLRSAASSGVWRAVVFRIGHRRVKGV